MSNSKNFCETDFLLDEPAQIVDFYNTTCDTTTCDTTCDENRYKNMDNNTTSETMKVSELVPRPRLVNPNIELKHESESYVIHSEESESYETDSDDNNIIDQNKHQNKNKDISNISIDIKDAVHYDTENDKKCLVTKKKTISYNLNLCFAITGGGLFALTLALVYNYL